MWLVLGRLDHRLKSRSFSGVLEVQLQGPRRGFGESPFCGRVALQIVMQWMERAMHRGAYPQPAHDGVLGVLSGAACSPATPSLT